MSVEKIISIERSHRRVLLAALAVVVAIGLYQWILSPHTSQLLAAQRYKSSLDAAIQKANSMRLEMENRKNKIADMTKEAEKSRNQLFTLNEARQFFSSLSSIGAKSECTVMSVSMLQSAQQNSQESASVVVPKKAAVAVIGGYNNITRFINTLQSYEHRVWIDSVRIDAGGAGKLKCQITLTIYCIEHMENFIYE